MIIRHEVYDQQFIEPGEKYSCSVAHFGGSAGTFIKTDLILTATHCACGREHGLFHVCHLDKKYRGEKIVVHPEFHLVDKGPE